MTNFVKQKYQYFVDLQTSPDKIQVLTFTAGGLMPQTRLRPFFGAFKHFKLGKCRFKFVPAATLPVDPTGLSYEAGENTVDPRDQMNPGLVRITNGEDVSELTGILTGVDAEKAYYSTMLDPRWYKFQLQSGFKRSARPLLYNVGQTAQSVSQTVVANTVAGQPPAPKESFDYSAEGLVSQIGDGTGSYGNVYYQTPTDVNAYPSYIINPLDAVLMQTGRIRMGWMPTDMFNSGVYGPNAVPEVDLITAILPKAYKTSYFYRCYIEEEVLFKEPVASVPIISTFTGDGETLAPLQYLKYAAIDRFLTPGPNLPLGGNNDTASYSNEVERVNKLNGGKNV